MEESHQQQSLFGRERVKPHGWHEVGTPLSIDVRRCCLLCLLSIPKKVRSLSVSVSLSLSHSLSLSASMLICIQMMPVILHLLFSSLARISC